ncbi:ATP-grasp domain-containing protein [Lacipirellula sp.]|uniref:ATP-grasp domain-containing protein n=1 Tax=Lacipirellula sp. TaxID=2691419 RepID=UPI003D10CC4C
MPATTWVLEPDVFPETHAPLRAAIRRLGLPLYDWSDSWWSNGVPAAIRSAPVVFHGSLGNAARIAEELAWSPGSLCPVERFRCSAWYESARPWLVHERWRFTTALELAAHASSISQDLHSTERLFIRPDSPLKPFSGRVLNVDQISLAKLDHGFYYDDESLPVVAAPVRTIGSEWRFVVVDRKVVAGSAYDAATRKPIEASLSSAAGELAAEIAQTLPPPATAYIIDVCECDGAFRLLELNPFGGADLYACNAEAIVRAVSEIAG